MGPGNPSKDGKGTLSLVLRGQMGALETTTSPGEMGVDITFPLDLLNTLKLHVQNRVMKPLSMGGKGTVHLKHSEKN